MADSANTGVSSTAQATCAVLAEALHDADDAYLEAVAGGIMDRQAEIDARGDALVAFLTGPYPANVQEAHAVIIAAMQAVIDGAEFDPAWRASVSVALVLLGGRGPKHTPTPASDTTTTDYHVWRYQDYLRALAVIAARPDNASDDDCDAQANEANDIFDDLMEGSATSFTGVMLKARAAHHWAMQYAQGSVMSPRTFANLFGIMAADLEVLTVAGKAVRS
jgi:hypothetical protein